MLNFITCTQIQANPRYIDIDRKLKELKVILDKLQIKCGYLGIFMKLPQEMID